MKKNTYSVRGPTFKNGWYVPILNGKDLPITTFDHERAWELAKEACDKADLKEQQKELTFKD
jgi:hypothetical protein